MVGPLVKLAEIRGAELDKRRKGNEGAGEEGGGGIITS